MTQALALGAMLGLASGVIPGPFSALIAATALDAGFWAGFRVAVVPLLSETVALLLSMLALSQLPEGVLRWMGIAGGTLMFYLAHRTWTESRKPPSAPAVSPDRRTVEGLLLAVVSPAPWVFWLLVGGPLFLQAWRAGAWHGAAFFIAFVGCLVGVHLSVAGLAAYGHKRLPRVWRSRLMVGTAALLVVGGAALVWQSWIGNFDRMVQGTAHIPGIAADSLDSR